MVGILKVLLSQPDLRLQWRDIADRSMPPKGKRQVDFLPLESALCGAASLVVNHRRFGSTTAHTAGSPVPELAALFKRSNSSILAKMANIDGSRPHMAKQDAFVASEVLAAPEIMQAVYLSVFKAAEFMGIGPDLLPDFLGLLGGADFAWLGQDEIEPVLGVEIEARLNTFQEFDLTTTERIAEVNVRVGQHRFAYGVLENYGRRCGFCGMPSLVSGSKTLLRASHIKPWASSTDRERHDIRNGVAACPTHDAAFDSGLMTVNGGLAIHVSSTLERELKGDRALQHAFGRPPLRDRLQLPPDAAAPGDNYLAWHRKNVWAA